MTNDQSARYTPEERQLRRYIALAMLFSPTMCVLPLLAFSAHGSRIAPIIWGIWGVISLVLLTVIWRAANKLRHIAVARDREQH